MTKRILDRAAKSEVDSLLVDRISLLLYGHYGVRLHWKYSTRCNRALGERVRVRFLGGREEIKEPQKRGIMPTLTRKC